MRRRIREIIRKEFIQTLRDPRMRATLFVPPILQLIMFGYAVNLDVEHTRIAWIDQDRTPDARELEASFRASRYFEITARPESESETQSLLDHGKVTAAISILPGFARDIQRGNQAKIQILVDGTNSNTASLVSNYAGSIIADYAAQALSDQQKQKVLARGAQSAPPANIPSLSADSRVWFNPDLKSRHYFVPGVIVNILMLVTMTLTALAIVREREIGTMEQLMVTPVRPIEIMLGKTLPFALVGLVDLVLIVVVARLLFQTPFRGSGLLLLFCGLLYLMTTLGAGLFISTVSRTQQQAILATFIFAMPAFMLSGFNFPIRNMPEFIQWMTYLNPVRYFMDVVRGIFLKGAGLDVLWPQVLALGVYGVSILTFSALRFHKNLD
jgi:drug efflux transport system permease protein